MISTGKNDKDFYRKKFKKNHYSKITKITTEKISKVTAAKIYNGSYSKKIRLLQNKITTEKEGCYRKYKSIL